MGEQHRSIEGAQADVELLHRIAGQLVLDAPLVPKPDRKEDIWWILEAASRDLEMHVRSARALVASEEGKHTPFARQVALRAWLMQEELSELLAALRDGDEAKVADGIVDLLVVTIGTASSLGFDLELLWQEVQKANLAKFPEHEPCKGMGCAECNNYGRKGILVDGKFTKPEGWTPPDIAGVLALMRARAQGAQARAK